MGLLLRTICGCRGPAMKSSRLLHTAWIRGNVDQAQPWHWWGALDCERISTLDPRKLTVDDIVDPSYSKPQIVNFDNIYPEARLWFNPGEQFPSTGDCFLYYHCPPGTTAFSSSIRLRRISKYSVKAFQHGSDLTFPNGLPWQIMACQMAVYDIYEALRKKLIADGLWTRQEHAEIYEIFRDRGKLFPDRTLFSLQQEFPLSLNSNLTLTMAGKGEHRNFALHVLGTGDKVYKWPFMGNTIARFERSPLPEHETSPAVCIRIMRVFSPIRRLIYRYPGPKPAAGELLPSTDASGEVRPWAYPLTNNANSRALRLLLGE
ncbi:hypothetical protein C8R47DRAFT_1127259 [Mycena vitilis]|nr:hypothetical protein C8R47DRAFT_1127259 [Mycena vitilis]